MAQLTEQNIKDIIRRELGNILKTDRYVFDRNIQILNARNIQLGRTNGTMLGTATDQKLSFFGSTPVIQQTTSSQTPATFSAGTSLIANDTATWDSYTIGDIVAILKAFGLIA
jgi:hypothetical protein